MTRQQRRGIVGTLALGASLLVGLTAGAPQSPGQAPTPQAAGAPESPAQIAESAYVYGYPLMLVDATHSVAYGGTTNRFEFMPAPPTAADRSVVRMNTDTLHSVAFLDLSAEPVVVHSPDTHGRYFVMQMMDAFTNVFAAPGKRTMGTDEQKIVVVGPNWKNRVDAAEGMTVVRSPTNLVWIIDRVQLNGDKDVGAVNALQKQLTVAPLSEWPQGARPPTPIAPPKAGARTAPATVNAMSGTAYFNKLALLMKDNPPSEVDASAIRKFAAFGVAPGAQFNPSPDRALVADRARDLSLLEIKDQVGHLAPVENGWQIIRTNVGRYGSDYLRRAAVAAADLGASLPDDAVCPMADRDGANQPLTGSKNYVLHFDRAELPPVNAFWSLTAYDRDGHFIPNPLNRFAARDAALTRNPDGSVDIYLQSASPGKAHEKNWLPTPKDAPFSVALRMYWPKPAVLDGSYTPPALQAK